MLSRHLVMSVLSLAVVACLSAVAAHAANADSDQQALQGRWERKLVDKDVDAHGGSRAVKEISGNRETVTYYDETGQAVYATAADFKLDDAKSVRIYTYSNFKVTQGKEVGGEAPKGNVSYIYKVEGDLYYEAHGLLTTSPSGAKPRVVEWKRAK